MTAIPTFVGVGSFVASTGGPIQPTFPAAAVPGDLLILAVQSSNEAIATPSGWTECPDSPQGTGTAATAGAVRLALFYAWATHTLLATSTAPVADSGNHTMAVIAAFRGVNRTAPFDVTAGGTEAGGDTSLSATGDTTTVANCLVGVFVGHSIDGTSADQYSSGLANADLGSLANAYGYSNANGTGGGLNLFTGTKAVAGAFGATTATYAANSNYAFITLALAPTEAPWIVGRTVQVGGAGDLATAWPTGHAADDVALLIVESCGGEPVSTPADWSTITNSPQATGAGTAGTQLTVFYRRATSGAESDVTTTDPGDHQLAAMIVFRNCIATGDPINVTSGGVKSVASTSVTITGVTTSVANCLVVALATTDEDATAGRFSAWANANLAAPVDVLNGGTTLGNGGGMTAFAGVLASVTSSGDTTATVVSSVNAFMTIALKPPAAAPPAGGARSFAVIVA